MNLRHILLGAIVVAALALGGLWLFLRHEPAQMSLNAFQQSCIEGQRRGAVGEALPLDAESEAKALAYCDCVAAEVTRRLGAEELAALGFDQAGTEVGAKLDATLSYCRDRTR